MTQLVAFATALNLPSQLTHNEQSQVLESLGLGTTTKFLSQAYPFGGHSGFEISLAMESVSTRSLSSLGSGVAEPSSLFYPNLTIGKGIFNNSEIFFNFTPQTQASGISRYGMSFRWSFYQAQFWPLNFSFVAHASSANIQNQLITRNVSGDLTVGLTLSQLSLFAGAGWVSTAGQFSGGPNGLTLSQQREGTKVDSAHMLLGLTYNFEPYFIGASVDHYQESTLHFKMGLLF